MGNTQMGNSQQDSTQQIATVVASQLRLGPGFHERDREHVVAALESLDRHLARWRPERVDLRVSVKERETLNQRVTLEIWVPGCNPLIANSHERNIDHALIEVRKVIVREIEEERSRREPHKGSAHQTH